jgi:hypothetical protein
MDTYEEKLGDVRQQREAEATSIHGKISKVKSTVVTEAAKTIDMVDEVRDSLAASKKEMASQLAVFKNQLSQLSSVSSDHDQDDIDALESGLFTLESGHNRLLDKVSHFFHYDEAFNEEVEGQLRAMGKAIDSDDVNAEADELAQELSMNGQLNGLKDRFSEQVSGASSDSTKAFGGIAQGLADGITGLLRQEERSEKSKRDAEERARRQLGARGLSQAAALRSVNANELNLEKQAALLHKATGEAQAEVRAMDTAYGDCRKCWLQLFFRE